MKAPIWYLPAKISSFTGGDGWHRSYLMDVAFQHLDKWWLAGMPIKETAGWFAYDLEATGGADMTNQFLTFGIVAGLAAMVTFIFMLVRAFSLLGIALATNRSNDGESSQTELLLWGLGTALAAHIVNWIGITYFDQIYAVWFLHLAAISSLCNTSTASHEQRETFAQCSISEDVPNLVSAPGKIRAYSRNA